MTVDEHDLNGSTSTSTSSSSSSFQGLMQSLNLDPQEFKEYQDFNLNLSFQQLDLIKQDIERQLKILFDLLRHKYNCDMESSLISSEGFPRNDIDVVSVRLIRVRIIRLKNDYKSIIHLIDEKMSHEFAQRQANQPIEQDKEGDNNIDGGLGRGIEYNIPFARVAEVVNGGPAYQAGLKENDQIILFDQDIHASNNNRLRNLASRVKVGKSILVEIKRNEEKISLTLIPSDDWNGQGLLGCRLLPI